MFSVQDFRPHVSEDQILAAQGVPAAKIQPGSPVWQVAAKALTEGVPLLQPWLSYKLFPVKQVQQDTIQLEGGHSINNPVLADYLADADKLLIGAATLGARLDHAISRSFGENDPARGMALDTFGSLAIEDLAGQFSHAFTSQIGQDGRFTSTTISPGIPGWEIATAQPLLFALLAIDPEILSLSRSAMMQPQKSLTWVMGIGSQPQWRGNKCDLCSFAAHCTFACQEDIV